MMKLERGQVAVVTGAASGTGFALAEALCERGLRVVLADVDAKALKLAGERLSARGLHASACVCDVTERSQVEDLAWKAFGQFGRVDLLVNGAGVGDRSGPVWETQERKWAWSIGLELLGATNLVYAFLPSMLEQGSGHLVTVVSPAALTARLRSANLVGKHPLIGFTESLAGELAARNSKVRVSVVRPGVARRQTKVTERSRPERQPALSRNSQKSPARSRTAFGQPVANPIAARKLATRILSGLQWDELVILPDPETLELIRQPPDSIELTGEASAAA